MPVNNGIEEDEVESMAPRWMRTVRAKQPHLPAGRLGRLGFPLPLLAYPFYLWKRSPGKTGSHYDPACDLFQATEKNMVLTSNAFMIGMCALLAAGVATLGPITMINLYFLPYWVFVAWLDVVTYLHHHGPSDPEEQVG